MIYSRELERDIPAAEILRDYRSDIDSIHWRVGLTLQARSERIGGTEARLTRVEFSELVLGRLKEEEHEGQALIKLADAITEAAAQRLVFLVGHETDAIGFEIRSLQEFMAAEALHEGQESVVQARLRIIAGVIHWRNVLLFAVGRCFARDQALRDTVVLICQELNSRDDGGTLSSRLLLGSDLALEILEDGSCRRQPKYVSHLFSCVVEALDEAPLDRAQRLAEVTLENNLLPRLMAILSTAEKPEIGYIGRLYVAFALMSRGVVQIDQIIDGWWKRKMIRAEDVIREGMVVDGTQYVASRLDDLLQDADGSQVVLAPYFGLARSKSRINKATRSGSILQGLRYFFGYRPQGQLQTDLTLELADGLHRSSMLSLTGIRDGSPLSSLADLPPTASSWEYYRTVGEFVAEPSPQRLISVLQAANNYPNIRLRLPVLPWPALALLKWHRRRSLTYVQELEDGRFGSVDDWAIAESRWAHDGVSRADIEDALGENRERPFGEAIGTVGFPVSVSTSTLVYGVSDLAIIKELDALRRSAEPSTARSDVARLIAMLLQVQLQFTELVQRDTWSAHTYMDALKDSRAVDSELATPLHVVSALIDSLDSHERAEAYDIIGGGLVRSGFDPVLPLSHVGTIIDDVVSSFVRNPDKLGHARILASLAEVATLGEIDERVIELAQPLATEEGGEEELLLLRLAIEGPAQDFVERITSRVTSDGKLRLVARVAAIMFARGLPQEVQEDVLIAIDSSISGEGNVAAHAQVASSLTRLQSHRKSGLHSEKVCGDLCLPNVVAVFADRSNDGQSN